MSKALQRNAHFAWYGHLIYGLTEGAPPPTVPMPRRSNACSAQPGGLSAEKRGAEAAKAQAKALGFEREDVLEAAARVLAAAGIELPPVCAVVGGMVAQEVVKAVSKKGRPMAAQTMANAFFFDAFDQRGTYATVTPAL